MSESRPRPAVEREAKVETLPKEIAERFLAGSLSEAGELTEEDPINSMWRVFEREIEVPGIGNTILAVDYRQHDTSDSLFGGKTEHFDQVRFDYEGAFVRTNHEKDFLIAEMHWYIEKGEYKNPYPFDLMMVHRYVVPEFRNHQGIGTNLYLQAEAWAQQVADIKGEPLILALSTDQPLTMDWAEKLGYRSYPEEEGKRKQILEHPEDFELISETDRKGQDRNPALKKDGESFRVWFQKKLIPGR